MAKLSGGCIPAAAFFLHAVDLMGSSSMCVPYDGARSMRAAGHY